MFYCGNDVSAKAIVVQGFRQNAWASHAFHLLTR
jgi:hypothetical protein